MSSHRQKTEARRGLLVMTMLIVAVLGCDFRESTIHQADFEERVEPDLHDVAGTAFMARGSGTAGFVAAPEAPPPRVAEKPEAVTAAGVVAHRQMKIYTADVELEVEQISDEVKRLENLVDRYGGYIAGRSLEAHGAATTIWMQVRIPSEHYDAAMRGFAALGRVVSADEEVSDVTMEYIDVQARLKNLKREEEAVVALLTRQGKLSDVLAIEQELARVRTEIESTQGRMRYLDNQVAFSTIDLSITERVVYPLPQGWSVSREAHLAIASFLDIGKDIVSGAIYALVFSPYALALYAFYKGVRIVRRRRRAVAM